MSIDAMKLALEALEYLDVTAEHYVDDRIPYAAITALRQAIEQAQKQEPVAKVVSTAPKQIWLDLGFDPSDEDEISFNDLCDATWSRDNATGYGIEYVRADLASPPQRQPLTDEMRKQMKDNCDSMEMRGAFTDGWLSAEAAHGIKGEA